jgi:hypothetical protein
MTSNLRIEKRCSVRRIYKFYWTSRLFIAKILLYQWLQSLAGALITGKSPVFFSTGGWWAVHRQLVSILFPLRCAFSADGYSHLLLMLAIPATTHGGWWIWYRFCW